MYYRPEQKAIILFESGARIHQTTHDWPKSTLPSQFSMKFRKHINQKRLISIKQLGVDRIVDMQFGEEGLFLKFPIYCNKFYV